MPRPPASIETIRPLTVVAFLLLLPLSGCHESGPRGDGIGLTVWNNYSMSVEARISNPMGENTTPPSAGSLGFPVGRGSANLGCDDLNYAPWWVRITLYEGRTGGRRLDEHQWNMECGHGYILTISPQGRMTLEEE
jgi:hypothetical protein